MWWIFSVFFFLVLTIYISKVFNRSFSKALPCTISVLLSFLFVLALINKLNWTDIVSAGCSVVLVFLLIKKKAFFYTNVWEVLLLVGAAVILCYFCRNHISSSHDELRYWALETRTIYYLNGFSSKGNETAFLYGDYHPGLALFMWWFCHFSPKVFSEGLMQAGYWFLFSIPIISVMGDKLKGKAFIGTSLFIALVVIFLPSVFSNRVYETIGAELPLSSFFALLLYEVFQSSRKTLDMIYVSLTCLAMTFMKMPGMLWAIIALIIGEVYLLKPDRSIRRVLAVLIPSICFVLCWKVYCYVMERTNYLSLGFSAGEVFENDNLKEMSKYVSSYVQAFFKTPLHLTKGINGISAAAFSIVFLLVGIILKKLKILSKRETNVIAISYIILQIIFFIALIFLCTFVFKEIYYYDASSMISIISRYGIVVFLGFTLLYFFFLKTRLATKKIYERLGFVLAAILFVIIFSEKNIVHNELIFSGRDQEYILNLKNEIESKYKDAFSQKNAVIIIENRNKEEYWWEERFIRYYGAPTKILLECSNDDNLHEDIEKYRNQYGINLVYTYGFNS